MLFRTMYSKYRTEGFTRGLRERFQMGTPNPPHMRRAQDMISHHPLQGGIAPGETSFDLLAAAGMGRHLHPKNPLPRIKKKKKETVDLLLDGPLFFCLSTPLSDFRGRRAGGQRLEDTREHQGCRASGAAVHGQREGDEPRAGPDEGGGDDQGGRGCQNKVRGERVRFGLISFRKEAFCDRGPP